VHSIENTQSTAQGLYGKRIVVVSWPHSLLAEDLKLIRDFTCTGPNVVRRGLIFGFYLRTEAI